MPSEQKIEKLLLLLIRHTTEGELDWKADEPPRTLTSGTDDELSDFFVAVYKKQNIAVFERKYQEYNGDHDTMYWTSRTCFAFIDEETLGIAWETSQPQGRISTLFEVAKESAADVDGILDRLLG